MSTTVQFLAAASVRAVSSLTKDEMSYSRTFMQSRLGGFPSRCSRRRCGRRTVETAPQGQMQVNTIGKLSITQLNQSGLTLDLPLLQLQHGQKVHISGCVSQVGHPNG